MNDTPATWITVALVMSLLGAGLLLAGLVIGLRWHRIKRSVSAVPSGDSELDRLAGIGRAILGAQLKLDALCEVVYEQASSIVEARDFQLGLFEGDDYAIKIWLRAGERLPAQRFPGAAKAGLIGWVHQSAQVLRVNDFQREWNSLPAKPVYDSANPPRSAVFAPLLAAGQVMGVMAIYSDHAGAFSDQALHLLTVLSSQAAGAIRNAQLFEQTERRAHQLHVIGEVTRQIVAMQPLPDLFRQIVTRIQDTFHYYAVSILTPDEDSGLIRLRASNYQEIERRKYALKPGEGLIGAAFERAGTLYVPDVSNDPRYIYRDSLEQTKSEICVPLAVEKRVLGILDVQSDSVNAFNADDIATLEALAGQIAMALQEAQTYDVERRQAERINAMAEASRAVVSILDINDLLDQVVELVADHFGYDRVHLFLRSGDEIVFRSGSGVHSGKWTIQRLSFRLDDKGFIPWVARNGQSLVSGDAQNDERFVPVPDIEDSRSEMTIPIRMGQRVLGVFDIQSIQANAFNAEDVRLVQALADTVAIGLRNAGLFATETRRRMLAESLREVSTVLASSLDLPSVLDGILVGLERVVHYDAAIILLREEEQAFYTVNAFRGSLEAPDMLGETVPADDQLTEHVQELIHRIQPAEVTQLEERQHDHLYVALQVGGKDIGVLGSERSGPDHFTPEDVEIITTFANQAAVAIANAQLYMAQKEEAWISTALLQVAEATGRATSLDDVLRTVARITPLLVGVQWCAVFLANPDSFRVVEVEGADPELAEQLRGYTIKDADWEPLAQLRHTVKPVVIGQSTPRPTNLPIQGPRIQQGVLLPLIAKGEVMGAMLIGQQGNAELMTARKIDLVSGIANQAALAIESSQLFTAQQEEAWVTTALLSVAESLNSVLGLDQTIETIVRLVPMLVGTERCGVMLWDASRRRFVHGEAWGLAPRAEQEFEETVLPAQDSDFVETLAAATEVVPSANGTLPIPEDLARLFGTDRLLGLPLVARGSLIGAMFVDQPESGQILDQRRMNILTGTARQLALAMEAARLQEEVTERKRLERELEVAQGIQMSFLPQQVPEVPGWELSSFYRAARQVGGDFYDFIPLKDGRWGIVIADVADKGVPAALFMALSRTNIRAVAFNRANPAETLARVNDLLLSDSRSDLFVTVWYGVWNPSTAEIVYASAGHNPPILVRSNGQCEELIARGIALGVISPVKLDEKRITLAPGDVLLPYTDGVTEALRADGEEFGVLGLQTTAASVRHRSAIDIKQRIVESLDSFTVGTAQFDDLTFIVLKRLTD